MTALAGRVLLTILLFAASAVCFADARLARQMADAHRSLATLEYDAAADVDEATWLQRVPIPGTMPAGEAARDRAITTYWRAKYDALKPLRDAAGTETGTDSRLLLIAANAAFRGSHPETGERTRAIERLDAVVQQYADVLRADPGAADAAYNYEYVLRVRNLLAKAKGPRSGDFKPSPIVPSVDLPAGPTVHGRPGGPPPGVLMSDFKTIIPKRSDEREEQNPGQGGKRQRRG
jgi:hypothetical protein